MAKKASKKKASKKKAAAKRSMPQGAIVKEMAARTGLEARKVRLFFEELNELIVSQINPKSSKAPGVCLIPGIGRVKTRKRPARKARKGVNPFTGEEQMFKARPASVAVKILPVKKLKDAVN